MSLFKRVFALRRLFQFRLPTLLLCVLVAGVVFAWWRDRQRLERELETRNDLIAAFRTVRDDFTKYTHRKPLYTVWLSGSTRSMWDFRFGSVEAFFKSLRTGEEWTTAEWPAFEFENPEMAKQALPGLFEMLDDQDPKLRRRAAYAIGEIGPRDANDVTRLARSVNDKWNEVRIEALKALQKFKAQASHVAPSVADALDYDEPEEAKLLIETIREIDPSFELAPHLVNMLRHRSAETRVAAAELVCGAGPYPPSIASAVMELLSDDVDVCRSAAAKAMSSGAPPETALPVLLAAFKKETDAKTRHAIAQVISDTDRKLAAARAAE
jgi:hypothetical protein